MGTSLPNQSELAVLNALTAGPQIFNGIHNQDAAASCVSKGWARGTGITNQVEITDEGKKALKG